ncbi:MAG: hypothetical protein LBP75_08420 [Planctomycetota bacterium]|jgi:hypothetical protein|nr:hypothetical protein [Planctomycetota bacterium]
MKRTLGQIIEKIGRGGLKKKSAVDALHIALATLAECDYVVSWNCKHIVVAQAMEVIELVNCERGLKQVRLVTPTILLGGQDDEL